MPAPRALDRVHGCARIVAWTCLLGVVYWPWANLGGLVDERLIWLERCVLWGGAWAGCTAGGFARDACGLGRRGWTHARWMRLLVWPALGVAALALVGLECVGADDVAGVWLTATLAWCAGLDVALAAWPLACGRDYRFASAVDLGREDDGVLDDPP